MALSMLDQMQIAVDCEGPKCGKRSQIVIGRLENQSAIPCDACGLPIRLEKYAREIKEMIETATELDKQRRQRGELIERGK